MYLRSTKSMASQRVGSHDIDENIATAVAEKVSSSLPIYEYRKLYLDRGIKLKWKEVNETFAGPSEEGLEDH